MMLPYRAAEVIWFAQLQLLFCISSSKHAPDFAVARWFAAATRPARAANLKKLQPLKWETIKIPSIRGNVPKTDIVQSDCVIGPCFIQPDVNDSKLFWNNRWVGNVMNDNTSDQTLRV